MLSLSTIFFFRYFSLQATEPLGLGDAVRMEVESRICDERGVQPDCFVAAQCVAYDRMNEACVVMLSMSCL